MRENTTCNQSNCIQSEKINEIQKQLFKVEINNAVNKNNISVLKGDIESMNNIIEKIGVRLEERFDKITGSFNKLVWFNMTTSVGILGNLIIMLIK